MSNLSEELINVTSQSEAEDSYGQFFELAESLNEYNKPYVRFEEKHRTPIPYNAQRPEYGIVMNTAIDPAETIGNIVGEENIGEKTRKQRENFIKANNVSLQRDFICPADYATLTAQPAHNWAKGSNYARITFWRTHVHYTREYGNEGYSLHRDSIFKTDSDTSEKVAPEAFELHMFKNAEKKVNHGGSGLWSITPKEHILGSVELKDNQVSDFNDLIGGLNEKFKNGDIDENELVDLMKSHFKKFKWTKSGGHKNTDTEIEQMAEGASIAMTQNTILEAFSELLGDEVPREYFEENLKILKTVKPKYIVTNEIIETFKRDYMADMEKKLKTLQPLDI